MTITAVLNPRFNFLNSNSLRNKADFRTRERRAIIDILIPNDETYISGGNPIDISKIRNFIQVYAGFIVKQPILASNNLDFRIVPGPNNIASEVRLAAVFIPTGVEVDNGGDIVNGDTIISAEIIGI